MAIITMMKRAMFTVMIMTPIVIIRFQSMIILNVKITTVIHIPIPMIMIIPKLMRGTITTTAITETVIPTCPRGLTEHR